jgi:hypothetical protein
VTGLLAPTALHYVASVGEKEEYIARAFANVTPYLQGHLVAV